MFQKNIQGKELVIMEFLQLYATKYLNQFTNYLFSTHLGLGMYRKTAITRLIF